MNTNICHRIQRNKLNQRYNHRSSVTVRCTFRMGLPIHKSRSVCMCVLQYSVCAVYIYTLNEGKRCNNIRTHVCTRKQGPQKYMCISSRKRFNMSCSATVICHRHRARKLYTIQTLLLLNTCTEDQRMYPLVLPY